MGEKGERRKKNLHFFLFLFLIHTVFENEESLYDLLKMKMTFLGMGLACGQDPAIVTQISKWVRETVKVSPKIFSNHSFKFLLRLIVGVKLCAQD